MTVSLSLLVALFLDKILGEPSKFHPLVGFGCMAKRIEEILNNRSRYAGVLAWSMVVVPIVLAALLLENTIVAYEFTHLFMGAFCLYLAIGWQSLIQHAKAVIVPLESNQMAQARIAVSMMVSRECGELNQEEIAGATTESVLENGADAIFSAIFWFCMAGIPGVVLYRLSNTLDAMWGYKNDRFLHFGWMAARMDDLLNYIPARLTAFSYALAGNLKPALTAWNKQGQVWKSPNAGPVMAAGAGAINVRLGGAARYHGALVSRPELGLETAEKPTGQSIKRSLNLINRSLVFWLFGIALIEFFVVSFL